MGNFEIHKKPKKWNQEGKSFLSFSLDFCFEIDKTTNWMEFVHRKKKQNNT
jgi:hypothetical protein